MTNIRVLELPLELKLQRAKGIPVSFLAVVAFLKQDGKTLVRCEGWPEDAEVLAISPIEGGFIFTIYHPDFPIVLQQQPEVIDIKVKAIAVPDELAASIWDAWVEPEDLTALAGTPGVDLAEADDAPAGS